jgi:hypothetical protein
MLITRIVCPIALPVWCRLCYVIVFIHSLTVSRWLALTSQNNGSDDGVWYTHCLSPGQLLRVGGLPCEVLSVTDSRLGDEVL